MFEEGEEEEEVPVSPQPDVEPPPPIGQDRGQSPPQKEATPAALPNQEADSPDTSLKVCSLATKSLSAESQRRSDL